MFIQECKNINNPIYTPRPRILTGQWRLYISTKMKKTLLLLSAIFMSVTCFAQFETETHVFWQPDVKLTFDMFKGTPDTAVVHKFKDLNIYHQIATGFWSALDVPKSKREWKRGKQEKYYFCAAMDKTNSFFVVQDSTELKYAQLIWDICEVSTRISRKLLVEFVNQLNEGLPDKPTGGIAIQYMTCLNDGKQFGRETTHALFDQVITTHDEEAYLKFRTQIDSLLKELEEYATTEEEIRRLTTHECEDGYMLAPTLTDDFKGRGKIRY